MRQFQNSRSAPERIKEASLRKLAATAGGQSSNNAGGHFVTANTQTTPPCGTSFCHPTNSLINPCWKAASTP